MGPVAFSAFSKTQLKRHHQILFLSNWVVKGRKETLKLNITPPDCRFFLLKSNTSREVGKMFRNIKNAATLM